MRYNRDVFVRKALIDQQSQDEMDIAQKNDPDVAKLAAWRRSAWAAGKDAQVVVAGDCLRRFLGVWSP